MTPFGCRVMESTNVLLVIRSPSAPTPRSNRLRKFRGRLGVVVEEGVAGDGYMPNLVFSKGVLTQGKA